MNSQITLYHGDCLEVMKGLQDKSVDLIVADPPYGLGIDEWDRPIPPDTISKLVGEFKRIGREYLAIFGQMPYNRIWDREAERRGLTIKEHITWVKRIVTPSRRLSRGHEEIYIYAIGKKTKFYKTKGEYEDVKVPGVMFDVVSLEGIKRHIGALHNQIKTGRKQIIKQSIRGIKHFERYDVNSSRCPRYANFTNVWSFLPENRINQNKGLQFHPTAKSIKMVTRLVEMLTPEDGIVLDPFFGSGSTMIACLGTNRRGIGIELDEKYFNIAKKRIEAEQSQTDLLRTA